jgi:cytosine/adenosine deaminase-related metal-dependent hydrolase
MDAAGAVLPDADVLVIDDRVAAVGPRLEVPGGTHEIDAAGGIVMPGMIDTHRHMWQTAMRGYGRHAVSEAQPDPAGTGASAGGRSRSRSR